MPSRRAPLSMAAWNIASHHSRGRRRVRAWSARSSDAGACAGNPGQPRGRRSCHGHRPGPASTSNAPASNRGRSRGRRSGHGNRRSQIAGRTPPRRRPPTAPARRRHGHYAGGLCPAPVGTPMPASTTIRMCAAITAGLALPYSPGRGWKLTAMAPSPSPGSVPGDGRRSFGGRMAGGQCCGAPSCGTSPYRLQWNAMARGFYSAASALHAPAHGSAALAAAPLMRAGRRVSPSRSCGSDAPRC